MSPTPIFESFGSTDLTLRIVVEKHAKSVLLLFSRKFENVHLARFFYLSPARSKPLNKNNLSEKNRSNPNQDETNQVSLFWLRHGKNLAQTVLKDFLPNSSRNTP